MVKILRLLTILLLGACLCAPVHAQAQGAAPVQMFDTKMSKVNVLALSRDDGVLAIGGGSMFLVLYSLPHFKQLGRRDAAGGVKDLALNPAGDRLLFAGHGGYVTQHSFPDLKRLDNHFFSYPTQLQAVFLAGGEYALADAGKAHGRIKLEKGAKMEIWSKTPPVDIAAHPTRQEAYALHANRELLIHDAVSGNILETIDLGKPRPEFLALSPDGTILAIAQEAMTLHQRPQPTILLLDIQSRELRALEATREGPGHATPSALCWSPDGQTLYIGERRTNGALALSARDGSLAASFAGTGDELEHVTSLVASHDGKALIGATSKGTVLIWNVGGLAAAPQPPSAAPAKELETFTGVRFLGPNLMVRYQKGWAPEGWRELPEEALGEALGEVLDQGATAGAELTPGTGDYTGPRLTLRAIGEKRTFASVDERIALENELEAAARAKGYADYQAGILPLAGEETVYFRYFNGTQTVYVFYPHRRFGDGTGILVGLVGTIEGRVEKLPDTLKAVIRSAEVMASD